MAFWYQNVVFKNTPDPLADKIPIVKLDRPAVMLEDSGLQPGLL